MPRGRPPTPTYLKLIKGTPRSNRAKRKAAKVDPSLGPPVPPAFLLVEAREEWDAQCGLLHKLGMLTALDAAIFAAYCQAYGRWQRAEKVLSEITLDATDEATRGLLIRNSSGKLIQHPLADIARAAMADAVKYAGEIGLTPSARSKVRPEPPPIDSGDPAGKYLT